MLQVDSPLSPEIEALIAAILDCAFAVHRELGPGFKERIYHMALCLELDSRGMRFESEKSIDVRYRDWTIPGQRIDLIVAEAVIVEVKATLGLRQLHKRQVVSYLKATGLQAGLLLNFNTTYLKMGIRRVVLSPSWSS